MQTTAIIKRPENSKPIHVLECDGPRHKHHRRGDGHYYLCTSNWQRLGETFFPEDQPFDPCLKDWGDAHWEIYQHNDGRIEVHTCRPTDAEIMEGDLHGMLGCVIKIAWPYRLILHNALRLARLLCKCDPINGIQITPSDIVGISVIESNIPVYSLRVEACA